MIMTKHTKTRCLESRYLVRRCLCYDNDKMLTVEVHWWDFSFIQDSAAVRYVWMLEGSNACTVLLFGRYEDVWVDIISYFSIIEPLVKIMVAGRISLQLYSTVVQWAYISDTCALIFVHIFYRNNVNAYCAKARNLMTDRCVDVWIVD